MQIQITGKHMNLGEALRKARTEEDVRAVLGKESVRG